MTPGEVRSCLACLESLRPAMSRQDARSVPPSGIYAITNEGLRKIDL